MTKIPGRWLTVCLLASLASTALLMVAAHQTIDLHDPSLLLFAIGGGAAAGLRYAFRRPQLRWHKQVRDGAEYVGQFALVCLLGALASYPEAAQSQGFVDAMLARSDRLLHFDWVAWYAVVAAHPLLQHAGSLAYGSIFVTPALLLGWYAWAGRKADARRFLASFWLAAVLTLILFPRLPAIGPLAYLWHGPIPYMPTSALFQLHLIPALRSHALVAIDPAQLQGLVCAPSFHTTSAVLYIAAGWRSEKLRWPVLALNATMLLATPVEGTHYLTDMILGAAVGVAAIAMAGLAMQIARQEAARLAEAGMPAADLLPDALALQRAPLQ